MIDNWVLHNYDAIVKAAGIDGIKVGEAKAGLVERVRLALESGEVDVPDAGQIAEMLVANTVDPERDRRRNLLVDHLEIVAAAIADETVLGRDDPLLGHAYRIGTGYDKSLMFWSIQDGRTVVAVAQSKAAESARAASRLRDVWQPIESAMRDTGAGIIADLHS